LAPLGYDPKAVLAFFRQTAVELRALLDAADVKAVTVAETGDAMLHAASVSAARVIHRAEQEATAIRGAAELELEVALEEARRVDSESRAQVRAMVQRAEEEVDALFQRAKTRCEELWRMESDRIHDAETTVRRLQDGFGGRAVATVDRPGNGDGQIAPRPVTSEEASRLLDAYLSGDAGRLEQEADALAQTGVSGLALLRNASGNGQDETPDEPVGELPREIVASLPPVARPVVSAKAPKPAPAPAKSRPLAPTAVPAIVGRSEGTLLSRRVGRVGTVGDLALIFLLLALVVLLGVWLSRPM
jgi:hypothetical protein